MSNVIASLAWCWMQVLIVSTAAIGLSLLILRRSPGASATIALSGVVAALVLTALALVPFPARAIPRKLGELIVKPVYLQPAAIFQSKSASVAEQEPTEDSGFRMPLNRPLMATLLKSLRNSESSSAISRVRPRFLKTWVISDARVRLFRCIPRRCSHPSPRRTEPLSAGLFKPFGRDSALACLTADGIPPLVRAKPMPGDLSASEKAATNVHLTPFNLGNHICPQYFAGGVFATRLQNFPKTHT